MSAPPLIVIFGAAVRPDGTPSEALLRRIGYGLEAARLHPDAPVLCSGGVVRPGPSEASIMAEALIRRGVPPERLILDEASLDTIQNVAAAQAQAARGGHPYVIVCSEGYHLPRIRLLLRLHGVDSRAGPFRRGPAGAPVHGWLGMSLREGLAIPHNLAVMLTRRGVSPS
ncbi:YdcF family protein [Phenylobacterium sp.]|uniref:YdcF family protein n=1 Tax=Phenylobacterium sp. TaxID=1871053 RepID=UPI0025ED59CA|nr:YdcF family protein [Phenylobacterium sp.]MBX3484035.1 YdcF family protein [Phenylobacterium sp.]MCW5760043.1 YdcF family protein [Phenylobacterium sp.]